MDNQDLVKKIRAASYSEAVVLMNKHTLAIAKDMAYIVSQAATDAKEKIIEELELAVDLAGIPDDFTVCPACKVSFATEQMAIYGYGLTCKNCVEEMNDFDESLPF